jgi:hypothetical protein
MPGAMTVGDAQEHWTFGFLFDIILTRDPFMHRLDISRATGIPAQAAPAHQGDRAAQPAGPLLSCANAAPGASERVLEQVTVTADSHRPGS